MVPWGTGDPISSGDLNTLVFLTEKPPSLSVSIGGGSMSLISLVQQIDRFKEDLHAGLTIRIVQDDVIAWPFLQDRLALRVFSLQNDVDLAFLVFEDLRL